MPDGTVVFVKVLGTENRMKGYEKFEKSVFYTVVICIYSWFFAAACRVNFKYRPTRKINFAGRRHSEITVMITTDTFGENCQISPVYAWTPWSM